MKMSGEDDTPSSSSDPWQENKKKNGLTNNSDHDKGFSDAFVAPQRSFEKLPDSCEYLAGLESKLDRIKAKKSDLLKDLTQRRKDEMRRILDAGNWDLLFSIYPRFFSQLHQFSDC